MLADFYRMRKKPASVVPTVKGRDASVVHTQQTDVMISYNKTMKSPFYRLTVELRHEARFCLLARNLDRLMPTRTAQCGTAFGQFLTTVDC